MKSYFSWVRLCVVSVVFLALCACNGGSGGGSDSGDTGGCSVAGTYDSTNGSGASASSTVTTVNSDGSFTLQITVTSSGVVTTIHGTYTVSGDEIGFLNTSASASNGATIGYCPGVVGTYSMLFTSSCSKLTLKMVSDSCPQRQSDADGNTLTRR